MLTSTVFRSLSTNGRLWLYQSTDGNRIVVTSFPAPGKRYQLASGGLEPLWLSPTEVLYRQGGSWYLVRVNAETGAPTGPPALGEGPTVLGNRRLVQPPDPRWGDRLYAGPGRDQYRLAPGDPQLGCGDEGRGRVF